jgi:hypothetical protein
MTGLIENGSNSFSRAPGPVRLGPGTSMKVLQEEPGREVTDEPSDPTAET